MRAPRKAESQGKGERALIGPAVARVWFSVCSCSFLNFKARIASTKQYPPRASPQLYSPPGETRDSRRRERPVLSASAKTQTKKRREVPRKASPSIFCREASDLAALGSCPAARSGRAVCAGLRWPLCHRRRRPQQRGTGGTHRCGGRCPQPPGTTKDRGDAGKRDRDGNGRSRTGPGRRSRGRSARPPSSARGPCAPLRPARRPLPAAAGARGRAWAFPLPRGHAPAEPAGAAPLGERPAAHGGQQRRSLPPALGGRWKRFPHPGSAEPRSWPASLPAPRPRSGGQQFSLNPVWGRVSPYPPRGAGRAAAPAGPPSPGGYLLRLGKHAASANILRGQVQRRRAVTKGPPPVMHGAAGSCPVIPAGGAQRYAEGRRPPFPRWLFRAQKGAAPAR